MPAKSSSTTRSVGVEEEEEEEGPAASEAASADVDIAYGSTKSATWTARTKGRRAEDRGLTPDAINALQATQRDHPN